MASGRPLPHNRDAEASVLGGILLNPREALNHVLEIVGSEDFYVPGHQAIFDSIIALEEAGKPIDVITLEEQLRSDDTLGKAGGTMAIVDLAGRVSTAENIAYHARIVRDKATLRRMIQTASEVASKGFEDPPDVDEFVDNAEQKIFQLSQRASRSSYVSAKELLIGAFNAIERRYERKESITGVPTGFSDLDEMTAGFQRSDLLILAARPSVGKTALCLNIASHAAIQQNIPVLMFSLEMSAQSLVERVLCSEARVDSQKLRSGFLDQNDWMNLTRAASRIGEAPIWIDDTAAPSVLEVRAKARRFRSDKSIFTDPDQMGIVILDYLQLARGHSRVDNREQEVAEISRGLKALAKEIGLPVLALSQLRRAVEDRKEGRPQLSDLRESGAIEQDADVIMFIHRSEKDREENTAEIIIGKQRNGPVGAIKLVFLGRYTRFESMARQAE